MEQEWFIQRKEERGDKERYWERKLSTKHCTQAFGTPAPGPALSHNHSAERGNERGQDVTPI